ncbi:MAG TPA: ClbS/DfsB family four-helix bundle protein [Anaerolineales bacterium]|nr:ClbS/DfsB family four-helix bundle protein [Anaerolineales bacterium]
MTQPGAAGKWSVTDIVSHLAAYEDWLVSWLSAAKQGVFPSASVLDAVDIEQRNEQVYLETHALPLQQVIAGARQTFQELLALVDSFSEEDLINLGKSEWFVKPSLAGLPPFGKRSPT